MSDETAGREDKPAKAEKTPADWAKHWAMEFNAAKQFVRPWHTEGEAAVKAYSMEYDRKNETHWPLFTASVQTQEAMMYASPPKVAVARRYADPKDDVARVSGLILERMLNADVEREDDSFCQALGLALWDRLVPGGGFIWQRYVREEEDVPGKPAQVDETGAELAPEVPATKRVKREDVETDWVHWKDALWSAQTKAHHEVNWWARKTLLSRETLVERWPKLGASVPLNAKPEKTEGEGSKSPPWARAEVWEIWDRESRQVFHYVEGMPTVLDMKPDLYGLTTFFPVAAPWFANTTTSKYLPRPDYKHAKDIYEEIDKVSTRIDRLQRALKAAGVYDQTNTSIQQLLSEGYDNKLIPVANFSALAEKGGLRGAVDWMPLDQIVQALMALRDYRRELVEAHDQLTGKSDLMRGQATQAGETATSARIRGRYGSVRLTKLQGEFAQLASTAQRIRAELICKLFDPATIYQRSNAQYMTEDPALVQQAIDLLKAPGEFPAYRIEVKPESIAYTDFDAQKAEAMEVLGGVSQFLSTAGPLAQQSPAAMPFLLELLQATLARLKGGAVFEGILDRAIQAAQQAAQQPQQAQSDPKLEAEKMKLMGQQQKIQGDMAKERLKHQQGLEKIAVEVQADAMRESNQRIENVREAQQKQANSIAMKPPEAMKPGVPR